MERHFYLPLPPSVNQLYPGKVRRHKSDAYFAWERVADYELHRQGLRRAEWDPTHHIWTIEIVCYLPDRRRDVDNTLKSGIDFIAGFFALSDNYLDRIVIERQTDKSRPRWEVLLSVPGA